MIEVVSAIPFVMLLGWLALSDARRLHLPLAANLALSCSGLLAGGVAFGTSTQDRLLGWLAGFLVLQGLALAYYRLRGQHGIGGGDPLLLAGIGAWLGWIILPELVLGAALMGLVLAGASLIGSASRAGWRQMRLPLGTLLAVSSLALAARHHGVPMPEDSGAAAVSLPLDKPEKLK